jgi:hypothetical protein
MYAPIGTWKWNGLQHYMLLGKINNTHSMYKHLTFNTGRCSIMLLPFLEKIPINDDIVNYFL